MLGYRVKGLHGRLNQGSRVREIILDYPGGPDVVALAQRKGRSEGQESESET